MALEMRNENAKKRLEEARQHADKLGADIRAQLEGRLEYLEHYAGDTCVTELYTDWAPYSFGFDIYKLKDSERIHWFTGGLIFHRGKSNGVDFPELSVVLDPQDKPHWGIHT